MPRVEKELAYIPRSTQACHEVFRLARTRMAFTNERGARRIARSRIISCNVIRSPVLVVDVRKENPNFACPKVIRVRNRARFEGLYNFFQRNGIYIREINETQIRPRQYISSRAAYRQKSLLSLSPCARRLLQHRRIFYFPEWKSVFQVETVQPARTA